MEYELNQDGRVAYVPGVSASLHASHAYCVGTNPPSADESLGKYLPVLLGSPIFTRQLEAGIFTAFLSTTT